MATNQTGIAIVVKAWLPTGKTLDEQFNALSIVKDAHSTGDYSGLLAAATVEEVKTEQKTRRVEEQPVNAAPTAEETAAEQQSGEKPATDEDNRTEDADVPAFLKNDGKKAA